jgi:protein-tyrosine phosphatase-like protein
MSVAFDATVLKMVESEVRTIKAEYRGLVSEESIDSVADESLQRLANSRVPQFVPLFVGRFTRERLKDMVKSPRRAGQTIRDQGEAEGASG